VGRAKDETEDGGVIIQKTSSEKETEKKIVITYSIIHKPDIANRKKV
jgi:hypothetical protein